MAALLDWAALGKIGSVLSLQTSSMIGITEAMEANDNFEFQYNWTSLMFGNQQHPGDFHFNGFTERTLKGFLSVAGYDVDDFTISDGWLLSTDAKKARDWASLLSETKKHTDAGFLAKVHRRVLGRPIDNKAAPHWTKALRSQSRYAVLRAITSEPENLYRTAKSLGV
jgi:hypothetical protein